MELMKEDSLTSEEKLLRLIRKKDKSSETSSLPFQGNHATISPDLPGPAQTTGKPIDPLALAIRILVVMAGFILIFVVAKYGKTKPPAEQPAFLGSAVADKVPAPEVSRPSFDIHPFDAYKKTMEGRDIFQSPWEKPVAAVSASNASAAELVKQLKLVGILLDKDPKAIVEDLGTRQTFFVSPGEKIGSAIVSEVREDKVILIFGQEKVELVP